MKKLIKFLSSFFLILNSTMVLVACRPPSLGEIWIITDGGDLFDKSFNQQIVEGAQKFTGIFNENQKLISAIPGFEYWKEQKMRIKWIISKDGDFSTLQNNYNIASYAGAKTIICAGFHHISALTPKIQENYNKLGVKFILVDAIVDKPVNVAGLTYAAEQSSFLAGLAGSIWLVANHEKYGSEKLKMSTFGGLASDVVVEYMSGYYWGIAYFNKYKDSKYKEESKNILSMINKIRKNQKQDEMTQEELETDNYKIEFDKLENSFSGGFESGTVAAKAVTSQLINNNKNNIVFAVAGGQTTDLISAVVNSPKNSKAKIIGVDTDQSKLYSYAKDYFLTSALKGIAPSIEWMLWNSFNLDKNKVTNEIKVNDKAEEYFNGKTQYLPLTNEEYAGIANNLPIREIYSDLIETDTYWKLAKQVLASFRKLNNDLVKVVDPKKWENAWKNYIDINKVEYRPEFLSKTIE